MLELLSFEIVRRPNIFLPYTKAESKLYKEAVSANAYGARLSPKVCNAFGVLNKISEAFSIAHFSLSLCWALFLLIRL